LCPAPAKLEGHFDSRARGIFVGFRSEVDSVGASLNLSKKYGFTVATRYRWGAILSYDLDLDKISAIRCEADVEYVEFNRVITIT